MLYFGMARLKLGSHPNFQTLKTQLIFVYIKLSQMILYWTMQTKCLLLLIVCLFRHKKRLNSLYFATVTLIAFLFYAAPPVFRR